VRTDRGRRAEAGVRRHLLAHPGSAMLTESANHVTYHDISQALWLVCRSELAPESDWAPKTRRASLD
jgi:hypothetical protein